jgi:hypothetical protein
METPRRSRGFRPKSERGFYCSIAYDGPLPAPRFGEIHRGASAHRAEV